MTLPDPRPGGMTDRPDAPAPMQRMGPRPLALHLMLSGMDWSSSAASSKPSSAAPPAAPDAGFVAGVAAYRRHPYQRRLPDPPTRWAEGQTRMLDYGGSGSLVLVVPSLINRAYVLDLAPERSLLRHLSANGAHPLLLDWGWPGAEERQFGLAEYVLRLERALATLTAPAVLLGYCMGGLLALAAALRQPGQVQALALLATPWDFHVGALHTVSAAMTLGQQAAVLPAGSTVPVDTIQALFALADPASVAKKYRAFAGLDPNSERARMFVALEDWLADGVPLAARAAQECFQSWYGENTPGQGRWRVADTLVAPADLRMPVLIALPAHDRIVPPQSAAALAGLIRSARLLHPAAGHIGMVAGGRAREQLWQPLTDWLRAL